MKNKWRCGACGYRLEAEVPPEQCPGCHEKCGFMDDNPYVPADEALPEETRTSRTRKPGSRPR